MEAGRSNGDSNQSTETIHEATDIIIDMPESGGAGALEHREREPIPPYEGKDSTTSADARNNANMSEIIAQALVEPEEDEDSWHIFGFSSAVVEVPSSHISPSSH